MIVNVPSAFISLASPELGWVELRLGTTSLMLLADIVKNETVKEDYLCGRLVTR
jgi:hypothetical protein